MERGHRREADRKKSGRQDSRPAQELPPLRATGTEHLPIHRQGRCHLPFGTRRNHDDWSEPSRNGAQLTGSPRLRASMPAIPPAMIWPARKALQRVGCDSLRANSSTPHANRQGASQTGWPQALDVSAHTSQGAGANGWFAQTAQFPEVAAVWCGPSSFLDICIPDQTRT